MNLSDRFDMRVNKKRETKYNRFFSGAVDL